MSSTNIFSPISSDPNVQETLMAITIAAVLLFIGKKVSARLSSPKDIAAHVIPSPKFTWFSVLDYFIGVFVAFQDSILGKENRKYLPFTGSIFLFLLCCNLVGLVPGMPAATTTVWINVALALVVFFYFNLLGIREHGVWGYLKHFMGPVVLLAPFMFVLEIFSVCLRVLTLNLRLYWNVNADHLVLELFTGLLPPGFSFPVYFLGLFVSFMQAFIFTTLTMVYILLSTQHEEHDEEHAA